LLEVSKGQDASRVRRGESPQGLDAPRSLALAWLRSEVVRIFAEAFHECAAEAVRRNDRPLYHQLCATLDRLT
jgi:hypothetical protein